MEQTAVQWLAIEWNRIENIWKNVGQGEKHCKIQKLEALEIAKAIEKKQIIEACIQTTQDCWNSLSEKLGVKLNFTDDDLNSQKLEAEEYYNKTFKSE